MKIICPVLIFLFSVYSSSVLSEGNTPNVAPSVAVPIKPAPDISNIKSACLTKAREKNIEAILLLPPIEYPPRAIRIGQEGWVILSYDIVNHKVENIKTYDSSPEKIFDRAAFFNLKQAVVSEKIEDVEGCLVKILFTLSN